MSHTSRSRIPIRCALLVAPLAIGVVACGSSSSDPLADKPYDAAEQISFSGGRDDRKADPDKPLEITAKGGGSRITDVTATDATGRYLRGELTADGKRWRSTAPLAAGAHYTLRVSTENGDGRPGRKTIGLNTAPADKRLRVRFGPESGTYGVGQPVTAELSAPVEDRGARATVERALRVSSQPTVEGSWHWVDGRTLHYRPRAYWPTKATITVRSHLDGIKLADGLHGGPTKPLTLRTGARIEARTDASTHQMTVTRDGKTIRTIPITTGKPGFDTRNGVKVILAKESFVRMRGTSIGIAEGSSESYDLPVHWATRVTWSGEYVHAAPWSVGSQGSANVSHGCTGMSTANAHWFFDTVRPGDLVTVVGSNGATMTPFDNGFGDWNLSWDKWRQGSALTAGRRDGSGPADSARLRPAI
ncbi:L,D-transpeptidase [Streptomyces zagrosensis]|uniref:Lipoprotein-anchoring transpeptidase ErfK/SrfK n=1 Tax=Streptomyces zagrosensis TaxID=1042984 RepID=A0A7W9UWM2_9ACTN|nr:Ig-like domain-containing protein [Streptomyces zagrosensis]MBB5933421.1 lipoprotein-anchoring transpeptidase ErfK/SrfK [Streptomyces zagrosensis]